MSALHGVLVTYRRPRHLANHLDALAGQSRTLDSLVVVDNDPGQSARAVLAAHPLPGVSTDYLASGENLGPAGGIAAGMRHVLRTADDDDWIALFDDDDPPRTPELIGTLEEFGVRLRANDSGVGAVGLCGGRFDTARGRIVRVDDHELAGPVLSCGVAGNQLPMYSVHAVRSVGVFDEDLFFGFEELEYGLRMLRHGFRIYAHGGLWHREREHHGRLNLELRPDRRLGGLSWRRYYSLRNLIYILRGCGENRTALWLAAIGLAKPLVNLPRRPLLALQTLRLNSRAVRDAYRGRMGRTIEPVPKP
ncbi:MAG: glycosyltransferase [Propionibacteriales bacterium]|nr:glycosyltransferase [Propionibacteriales bacterium]